MSTEADTTRARNRMVEVQIAKRGVKDERVLEAMRRVRRHEFVPPPRRHEAYDDNPLPIGFGQTISQPYIVAWMSELLRLRPEDTVLEVGAGCGYQTAVLARLCRHVYALERIPELCEIARENLRRAGAENVSLVCADGHEGRPEHAPYARILVAAAAQGVPRALMEQLAPQGRLVIPLGSREGQEMTVVRRNPDGSFERDYVGSVAFVPLLGGDGTRA